MNRIKYHPIKYKSNKKHIKHGNESNHKAKLSSYQIAALTHGIVNVTFNSIQNGKFSLERHLNCTRL